jgi:hypothetical protein
MYKITQSVYNPQKGNYNHKELFTSASEIQIVLFLRNLWYLVEGKEIPPTNQMKGAAEFERKWNAFLDTYDVSLYKT